MFFRFAKYHFPDNFRPIKHYVKENEILKEAKNAQKWHFWSFSRFLASFKISFSSLQHPYYVAFFRDSATRFCDERLVITIRAHA